jgi:hypothetical protein
MRYTLPLLLEMGPNEFLRGDVNRVAFNNGSSKYRLSISRFLPGGGGLIGMH